MDEMSECLKENLKKSNYSTLEEFEAKEEAYGYFIGEDGVIYVKLPDDDNNTKTWSESFLTFSDVETFLDRYDYI